MKRLLLALPVLGIFIVTSLIFMAARAPQTWASHWSTPVAIGTGTGEHEYGAVPQPGRRWDLLWVDDDTNRMMFTPASTGHGGSLILDHGDVTEPSLIQVGRYEIGVWIRNRNGATDLMGAIIKPVSRRRVFRLLDSPQPIEHPALFTGSAGHVDLVYSWQRYGNFDLFLASLPLGGTRLTLIKRLTHAQSYSFYPRAVTDGSGGIDVLHLENCCQQEVWNVSYDRYDQEGHHLGTTHVLYRITSLTAAEGVPSQWPVDLESDGAGDIWGAFGGDAGVSVFKASPGGKILEGPTGVDPYSDIPRAVALVVGRDGGYLFWDQSFDLGRFLDSRRFDESLRSIGGPERVVYESASQTNPHATLRHTQPQVIWQAITPGPRSRFEESSYRNRTVINLAQRFGLGLGDPWSNLALLLIGSIGVAVLGTIANILVVFGLAILGLIALRLLRPIPGKWVIVSLLLSAALYAVFVAPGGPILFLGTMPSLGLDPVPFGIVALLASLAFITWMGVVALRRVEDLYRAWMMVLLGVYFFAFVEAIVFVQQRLGYI